MRYVLAMLFHVTNDLFQTEEISHPKLIICSAIALLGQRHIENLIVEVDGIHADIVKLEKHIQS